MDRHVRKYKQKITLVDQSGIPVEDIQLFTDTFSQNTDPQSYAFNTGSYYICNDIENTPELENWKSLAAQHAIRSCMFLPIKKSGKIIGTFNLYSTEYNFSSKEEIALLVAVTGDISFALDHFEKARRQKNTEELVVQNEKTFRTLISDIEGKGMGLFMEKHR